MRELYLRFDYKKELSFYIFEGEIVLATEQGESSWGEKSIHTTVLSLEQTKLLRDKFNEAIKEVEDGLQA